MPTIGNNPHTLLHGLSDFWTKFYADCEELKALYHGTEILLAQTYLDMLSSFLNISVAETPIFNTEYFKLILAREDRITYDQALNSVEDRYTLEMPDNVVEAHILQNKVIEPTASMEEESGYQTDTDNYRFRFDVDPSGRPLRTLGSTLEGHLLAYGTGALTRFYVASDDAALAQAKAGHWLRILNSASGNNLTFRIGQVLDTQTVLLQGTFTLPEANDGALHGTLFDSEFAPIAGFAHRSIGVAISGSFDDPTRRKTVHEGGTLEMGSWYADTPLGLGVRKGDRIRVFDRDAVPTVPTDFRVVVVRHDKLYLHADDTIPEDTATVADYVVLREPPDTAVEDEQLTFTAVNQDKDGVLGSITFDVGLQEVVFTISGATPAPDQFQPSDKFRYITLKTGGSLTFTGTLGSDGTLTRTGGAISNPFARTVPTGQVKITGSVNGQDGVYTLQEITSDTVAKLTATGFIPEPVTVALTWVVGVDTFGVRNIGTYKVKKYHNNLKVTLDLGTCYDDPDNGTVEWQLHDGYSAKMAHEYIVHKSVKVFAGAGNPFTGGLHDVVEGAEYYVNETEGKIVHIGRLAGTWGITVKPNSNYAWLKEILSTGTTGIFDPTATEVQVTEVAMWAPDALVDKFHLYQNYGYLIDRFQPSSETYREFLRGVFQLYILGPTLQRIESALNVLVNMPVIRDDGEVLDEYDILSDPDTDFIRTIRPDGTTGEYTYLKGTPIRANIVAWVVGDLDIVFESFEPLTTLFEVTDYIEDPTWWESIVIPTALMPKENTQRRTTIPVLYENILGQVDDPRIGDPGLFIGADDEGFVPANIASFPAKRRKMANVVMNVFLKFHIFFVRLDTAIYGLVEGTFIQDVLELVLVAKPGYKYVYIEPASDLRDTMRMLEEDIAIEATLVPSPDVLLMGNAGLTISSLSWNIGDVWRFNPSVPAEALTITNSGSPPGYNDLTYQNVLALQIRESGSPAGLIEYEDYWVDYKLGYVYPIGTWPAGTYTAEYASLQLTPQASKDASLGDTDYSIGGQSPTQVRSRHIPMYGAQVTNTNGLCRLIDLNAQFDAVLHLGKRIVIHSPEYRTVTVRRVVSATTVDLEESNLIPTSAALWDFGTEEARDGVSIVADIFKSASAIFRTRDLDRYVQITGSAGGSNDGYHRIKEVMSMSQVRLDFALLNETNLHWRMEGSPQHMDLIERPLQITIT